MNPNGHFPLIDRHTHLEGSLDPDWVRSEAQRRSLPLPASLETLWSGAAVPFEGFIEAFLFGAALLDSRKAVCEAVWPWDDAHRRPGAPGLTCGPRPIFWWSTGALQLDAFWRGLEDGLAETRTWGLRSCVVLDAVNHFGPKHGQAVLGI